LGATSAPTFSDGINPHFRGLLLHGLLEGLWQELQDQHALQALDGEGRRALIARHWERQLTRLVIDGRPPYPARLLERERLRSERLLLRILEIEDARPAFRVRYGERQLQLDTAAGIMTLRVDRLDEDEHGHHWLIDYKSGKAETIRLDRGEAQPLQLALYEQALAAQGVEVQGMALLSLAPAHLGYSGAAPDAPWPGKWRAIPDWSVQQTRWRQELATLLGEHVAGIADVAPLAEACRNCHLAALCRRADSSETADD
jgi:RecB family exonuclease